MRAVIVLLCAALAVGVPVVPPTAPPLPPIPGEYSFLNPQYKL